MDLLTTFDAFEKVFTFPEARRDRPMDALAFVKDNEICWTLPYAETEVINRFTNSMLLISLPILPHTESLATVLEFYSHLIARRLYLEIFTEQSLQVDEIPEQIEL